MARKRRMVQQPLPTMEPYDIVVDVLVQKQEQLRGMVHILGGQAQVLVQEQIATLEEGIAERRKVLLDKLV